MTLQENNYLYVDLQALITRATQQETAQKTGEAETPDAASPEASEDTKGLPTEQEDVATHKAWGDMLLSRLAKNRELGKTAKAPEEEIIQNFFKEYFNNVWGGAAAEQLIKIGALLRDDIQKLGWDKNTNPILAFIAQKYVSENLLATKQLNGETYKAIHNAIAKKLVAHSEFRWQRNYNIIYCKSFYNRPPADMVAYLEIQKDILKPSASKYDIETQKKNRFTFLKLKNNAGRTVEERAAYQVKFGQDLKTLPTTIDPASKLIDLETATKISGVAPEEKKQKAAEKAAVSNDAIIKLVGQIKDKLAHQVAILQQIAFTADDDTIKIIDAFLADQRFAGISAEDVFEASKSTRSAIGKLAFNADAVKSFIDALNSKD